MKEISGNIDNLTYTPDWRGIDDVTLIESKGSFTVTIERRWLDISRTVITEQKFKMN